MARPKTEVSDYKGLMVRLPESTLEAFKALAKKQRRSLNAQLVWVIEESLKDEEIHTHELAGSRND